MVLAGMNIVIALAALSVLIIVHELGHFTAAKLTGIRVTEFSIFMGPKLVKRKVGETTYSLGVLPIGGYITMEGENEDSGDARAYCNRPKWARAAVLAAGPVCNILVALLFVVIIFAARGYPTTRVSRVDAGSPAEAAGIAGGDVIKSFAGRSVYSPMDLDLFLYAQSEKAVTVGLRRDGAHVAADVELADIDPSVDYVIGFDTRVGGDGLKTTLVERVVGGYGAEAAGLLVGDEVVAVNGEGVSSLAEIKERINEGREGPIMITVVRDGETLDLPPAMASRVEYPGVRNYLGVRFQWDEGSFPGLLPSSASYLYSMGRSTVYSLLWLVTGKVSLGEMMGPVGIIGTIGETVSESATAGTAALNLMAVCALISVNLGFFNLIPFPALDGSKLSFLLVELIRGRPISKKWEYRINICGFICLFALMVFATSNDIMRFFG
ncbi:MAG: RIP metalloprotease RseP [Oscillospiraceae bacterium]|nr:RIP metalloprotease RseP [Oscillospiraceae bacterium]